MSPKSWAIAAILLLPFVAAAQKKEPSPEPPITVALPTDAKWERRLAAARDYIDDKDWQRATALLQSALDLPSAEFIHAKRRSKDGSESTLRVSLHDEAERMLRELPADGLAFYRAAMKAAAANLMIEAKANDSPDLFGLIVRRYFVTDSGPEALELQADGEFALGHPRLAVRLGFGSPLEPETSPNAIHLLRAARAFDKLIAVRGSLEALSQQQLIRAAVVYHSTGDRTKTDAIWKALDLKFAKEKPYLGGARYIRDQLRAQIDAVLGWPMVGGNPSRSGQTAGDVPYLGKLWQQSMFVEDSKGQANKWITDALAQLADRKVAAISAFTPITTIANVPGKGTKHLMVYRSHWGIHAVDLKTGLMMWDADCPWSLEKMYLEPRSIQAIDNWKQQYQQIGRLNTVLENSIIGSLSSDGNLVYVIDDLPVPPYLAQFIDPWDPKMGFHWGAEIKDAMQYNVLQAYDAGSGRMHWKLGGHGDRKNFNDPRSEMHDCYFLGPPLPLGGKLYAIHEKARELRLAVLDPRRRGTIERILPLAKLRDSMLEDTFRRLHAAHAAYGEGVIVCPTNAGAIVGVDLRSMSIAWASLYRQDKPVVEKDKPMVDDIFRDDSPERGIRFRLANLRGLDEWKNTAPTVVDGKVVFAAPDSQILHCLAVKDGSLLWKVDQRPGDLYLGGVYGDKVLIVGKERCRALNIANGEQAWEVVTGLPSGRGIASGNVYYLPLQASATTNEPEVCVIDMEQGRIQAHARSRKGLDGKLEVPGNLLFFDGRLLSQTATQVVAYPELAVKLKELDEKLKANPRDPAGLLERGQWLFDLGDLPKAVESLRSALSNSPAQDVRDRTRSVLFEALSALLQKDFNASEKDLKEYEELTKVEWPDPAKGSVETLRRRGIYFTVVAHGWEQIGKPVEALRAYVEFAVKAPPGVLLPAPDDPAVRVGADAWARGHILGLLKRATPEQRKLLEAEIEKLHK